MVEAAHLQGTDQVLEIGPGRGDLTRHLVQGAGRVLAVELDAALARALPQRVPAPNLEVLCADILDLKLSAILEPPGWKVVANLPYYITSPVLEKLLTEGAGRVEGMWLMVQSEVARRVVARGTREGGALSYFVQYHAEPRLLFTVPARAFQPPPQVESAVLELRPRPRPPFQAPPERLFRLVRAAFSARRKTLRRSLDSLLGGRAGEVLERAGIDPTRRPETLTLEEFGALARAWEESQR
jgi:16S rRNA (adenine1518-N6/adenine1519-N6)-dimethyltransferase